MKTAKKKPAELPQSVYGGAWPTSHMQGLTINNDTHERMYYSFTTLLIETDMEGKVLRKSNELTGHLGCIDYYDNKVYGSLERTYADDSFHIAIFDTDTFDMSIVELPDVTEDYDMYVENTIIGKMVKHKYGCSGIDGVTVGRVPGSSPDSKPKLFVAYGIFSDLKRIDNDYQVILQYDLDNFKDTARCEEKYFIFTGNTNYGVQNLEFDVDTGDIWMACYAGFKSNYPNYTLFKIDGSVAATQQKIGHETLSVLTLKKNGDKDGWYCDASTGLCSLGDGYFYVGEAGMTSDSLRDGRAVLCKFDEVTPFKKTEN